MTSPARFSPLSLIPELWWVTKPPLIVFRAVDDVSHTTHHYCAVKSLREPLHAVEGPMSESAARDLAGTLQSAMDVLES